MPDILPPIDLSCWPFEYDFSDLTWTNVEAYEAIHIYRDGCLAAEIPGDETSFTDYYLFTPWNYAVAGVIGGYESGRSECDLFWWGPDVYFDFDTSGDGFTPGGYADWEWGTPGHVIWGNAWETNIGRDYSNDACGWLDSPEIYLQFGGFLDFTTYDSVQCLHDGWNVQVSTDHGASWSLLVPSWGSYDQGEPLGSCDEGIGGDSNCGDGGFRDWEFDLLDFDNRMVKVRFLFESDLENTAPGVVMDIFVMSGGRLPAVVVHDRPRNPDANGDGTPDAYLGEYLTYSATFVNQSQDTIDFAEDHLFYAESDCPIPVRACPDKRIGPTCVGTLPPGGTVTRHFRVKVPYDVELLDGNPWVVETMARECVDGEVRSWGGRDCFRVTFLPPRHPPPEPLPRSEGFVFEAEEVDRPPR